MQVLLTAPRPSPHRYAGPYEDDPAAPGPHLVAIDATQYERSQVMRQFSSGAIERELNKAYVGFLGARDGALDGEPIGAVAAAVSAQLAPIAYGSAVELDEWTAALKLASTECWQGTPCWVDAAKE